MGYRRKIYYFVLVMITAACVLLGMARHFLGIGQSGRDIFGREETQTSQEGEQLSGEYKEELEAFTGIEAVVSAAEIVVEYGDSYAVSGSFARGMKPVCQVKGGKLVISQLDAVSEHVLGVRNTDCIMTVTVPKDAHLRDVSLVLDVGNIILKDLKLNGLELRVGTGNILCQGSSLARARVESGTGTVKLLSVCFDDMAIRSGPGDVTLTSSGSLDDCSMELSTDLGDVRVFGESYYTRYESKAEGLRSLIIDSDTGNVSVDLVKEH